MRNWSFVAVFLGLVGALILPSYAYAATLTLMPTSQVIGRGCPLTLKVDLNTQGVAVDGTDVVLTYDPQIFTATSILNGQIFSDFPGNAIDNLTGKVNIYALASQGTSFNGIGSVATVNFTASSSAALASQQIKFDFDPAVPTKTTDSNVLRAGTTSDILSSVSNGNYTIGSGACSTPSTVALAQGQQASTPSATAAPITTLPESGTFTNTLVVIGLGLILSLVGALGFFGKLKFN